MHRIVPSLSGRQLWGQLNQDGVDAIQFNAEAAGDSDIKALEAEAVKRGISVEILTFGQSGYDRCERDPDGTRRVNFDAVFKVARFLDSVGIRICAISSSAIFSGLTRLPTELTLPDPQSEYGRQKVEMEGLLSELEHVTVLRLTKVLSFRHGLLATWVKKLGAGEQVEAYANVRVAPVWATVAGQGILNAAFRKTPPTVHPSPSVNMSYAELTTKLIRRYSLPGSVVPVEPKPENLQGLRPGGHAALGTIVGLGPLESIDSS